MARIYGRVGAKVCLPYMGCTRSTDRVIMRSTYMSARALITSIAALFLAIGMMVIAARSAHAQMVCAGKYEQKVDFDRCMRDWVDPQPVNTRAKDKPVGKLPPYPPVVCVAPNWTPEPCENRQPSPTDAFGEVGKALDEFFKWLRWTETNWFGTVLVDYKPWNGVWPKPTTVLQYEPGGIIGEHMQRWLDLAVSGNDVEIRGPCFSACTLIVGYVPKGRLCFGDFASLQFHLAREPDTGKMSLSASLWMLAQYPQDIRNWLMARGGVANMTIHNFWELRAEELWDMGYRKCKSSTVLQWVGPGNTIVVPSGNNALRSGNDALRNYRPVWK